MEDKFLWGAATASYQVEGGIENNDWAEAARQGRVPLCGQATDHFHLFEKDFDMAKSLGHTAHRFSLEWARIEPKEGVFDQEVLLHYKKVIQALKERGITPFVTLWHFSLPLWFTHKGGFTSKKAQKYFVRYGMKVLEALGSGITLFVTINEPMVWATNSYFRGKWPPFKKNIFTYIRVIHHLSMAHKALYREVKKNYPHIQIGIAKNNIAFEGKGFVGSIMAKLSRYFWNGRFLNTISNYQDFIGLNYYFRKSWGMKKTSLSSTSDMGWEIYPQGLYQTLTELKKYKVPVYVTENGLADAADSRRADFIRTHIEQIERAKQSGVDIRGYLHWSLLDNYEWTKGFGPRFGLIEVDYATMERKIRPSALVYKSIIEKSTL